MYTVLFADDTPAIRTLSCATLRKAGYSVLEAEDGAQALSLARLHGDRIDLLVTDIMMPRMGGLELRRAMSECHPESAVLFISGFPEMMLDERESFLQKPFRPSALLSEVATILASHKQAAPEPSRRSISECA